MISCYIKKKQLVALNSVVVEYLATCMISCEALWLRKMLAGLFGLEMRPIVIHCDNWSCIRLSENPVFHGRSKHMKIIYHFIRDKVERGVVRSQYISIEEQAVDILTKRPMKGKFVFVKYKDKLG